MSWHNDGRGAGNGGDGRGGCGGGGGGGGDIEDDDSKKSGGGVTHADNGAGTAVRVQKRNVRWCCARSGKCFERFAKSRGYQFEDNDQENE